MEGVLPVEALWARIAVLAAARRVHWSGAIVQLPLVGWALVARKAVGIVHLEVWVEVAREVVPANMCPMWRSGAGRGGAAFQGLWKGSGCGRLRELWKGSGCGRARVWKGWLYRPQVPDWYLPLGHVGFAHALHS